MDDNRDAFIAEVVPGRSFLEVGGLWGTVNEKATIAAAAGAERVGALDIWRSDSEWWAAFRNRCAERNVSGVTEIIGSIDNPEIVDCIGTYDVVHCAGVLYHCPNPYLTIANLRTVTGEFLLLTSAVMPPVIENEHGRVVLDPDTAVLVPALSESKRRIFDAYITKAYGGGAYGVNGPIDSWFFADGKPNYGPWWWLWTAALLERIMVCCGFELVRSVPQFSGTGHLMMLRKVPLSIENYGSF
jgi:hypothetical protein